MKITKLKNQIDFMIALLPIVGWVLLGVALVLLAIYIPVLQGAAIIGLGYWIPRTIFMVILDI